MAAGHGDAGVVDRVAEQRRDGEARAGQSRGSGSARASAVARSRARHATRPAASEHRHEDVAPGARGERSQVGAELALHDRGEPARRRRCRCARTAARGATGRRCPGRGRARRAPPRARSWPAPAGRPCATAPSSGRARSPPRPARAGRPARRPRRRPTSARTSMRSMAPSSATIHRRPFGAGTAGRSRRPGRCPAATNRAKVTLLMPVKRPATIGESPNTVDSCSRDPRSTTLAVTTAASRP